MQSTLAVFRGGAEKGRSTKGTNAQSIKALLQKADGWLGGRLRMGLPLASMGFGFVAGMLSTLSSCVLPLLPLVLGPAMAVHRLGVAALAAGLVTSFVGVGLFVAMIGFSAGLDGDVFRGISACATLTASSASSRRSGGIVNLGRGRLAGTGWAG